MSLRFSLAILAIGAASATAFAGTPAPRDRRAVTIALVTAQDVDPPLMDQIVEEAGAIWNAAGITFEWTRATAPTASKARRIAVVIDDEEAQTALPEPVGPLGWIRFTPNGPEPLIHLSRARADFLCSHWSTSENLTPGGRQRLLGRALGRALAHELGHYLLQSKTHTRRGLMRAAWPADQLFSLDRRRFELTAEQRAATESLRTRMANTW
jgi:hypothetical protein